MARVPASATMRLCSVDRNAVVRVVEDIRIDTALSQQLGRLDTQARQDVRQRQQGTHTDGALAVGPGTHLPAH